MDARDTYLASQINTASPQKLQLMLIQGAIRFGNLALSQWESGDDSSASESIVRCRRIVTELLGGFKRDAGDLPRKIAAVYMFLFRQLTEAQLERNREKLRDALRVLSVEQETWSQVCEQLTASGAAAGADRLDLSAGGKQLPAPWPGGIVDEIDAPTGGISFEA